VCTRWTGAMCSQQSQIKTSRSEGSSKHFCQYYLYLWATPLSLYFGVLHGSGAQEGQISILRRVRSPSGKSIGGKATTRVEHTTPLQPIFPSYLGRNNAKLRPPLATSHTPNRAAIEKTPFSTSALKADYFGGG
jgi:hypothetical protein